MAEALAQMTDEVVQNILAEYRRTRSPFKAATSCGVDVAIVWKVIDENKHLMSQYQERHGGEGRPELRPFLVHTRSVNEREWDNENPVIVAAREAFEAGTHIMTTGRDGMTLLLYSIPRRGAKDPRPNYFQPEQS